MAPAVQDEPYLLSLASLGLERLRSEPARLQSEAAAAQDALSHLALSNYGVFIENHECVRHVRGGGAEMRAALTNMLSELGTLGDEFAKFQKEGSELLNGHKRNCQTLQHHMQLVELLEVPQLMDACVRNGLYEEALSIATFATALERRHRRRAVAMRRGSAEFHDAAGESGASSNGAGSKRGSGGSAAGEEGEDDDDVPRVVRLIVREVRDGTRTLRDKMLAQLRGPLQLSTSLQVVSCLRRLELLSLEQAREQRRCRHPPRRPATAAADGYGSSGASEELTGAESGSAQAAEAVEVAEAETAAAATEAAAVARQARLLEMRLQVTYLEARDAWLQDLLDEADKALGASVAASFLGGGGGGSSGGSGGGGGRAAGYNVYQYLMDLIEKNRTHWYEIATQFRAIFSDDGPGGFGGGYGGYGAGGTKLGGAGGRGGGPSGGSSGGGSSCSRAEAVLAAWLVRRTDVFLALLRSLLPLIDSGASLQNLLDQCMFFGASMGRLGFDFRGLLSPVFEEVVWDAVAPQWRAASAAFVAGLEELRHSMLTSAAAAAAPLYVHSTVMAADRGLAAGGDGLGDGRIGVGPPPASLMAFPLLARLVNALLQSLNQLRECAPLALELRLRAALCACFQDGFVALAAYRRAVLRIHSATYLTAGAAGSVSSPSAATAAAAAARGEPGQALWDGAAGAAAAAAVAAPGPPEAAELACVQMAERAVPHVCRCFAEVFGGGGGGATAGAAAEALAVEMTATLQKRMAERGIYRIPEPPPATPGSTAMAAAFDRGASLRQTASHEAAVAAVAAVDGGAPAAPATPEYAAVMDTATSAVAILASEAIAAPDGKMTEGASASEGAPLEAPPNTDAAAQDV